MGPCAKLQVTCTIRTAGREFVGRNDCQTPQPACPRLPGEGYEKCVSVCGQEGHAEIQAIKAAGAYLRPGEGAEAYLKGHSYYCRECQQALFTAGVRWLTVDP